MDKKIVSITLVALMFLAVAPHSAFAIGAKEAGASLLLPTTGQAMNGQLGNTKTKLMGALEVGLVTGTAILGGVVGGPVVWATAGPLIANHLWSATDAYRNAQNKTNPGVQDQIYDAQRTLEFSRQRRFEREQNSRMDIRERIARAGEVTY